MPIPFGAIGVFLGQQIAGTTVSAIVAELMGDGGLHADVIKAALYSELVWDHLDESIDQSLGQRLAQRTAAILADTQAIRATDVPAILAAIAAGGGGGGGWSDVIAHDPYSGANVSAGAALATAYRVSRFTEGSGYVPWEANLQFAWRPVRVDTYITQNVAAIEPLNPIGRPTGQSVLDYLNANDPVNDWFTHNDHAYAAIPLANGGHTRVICLVKDTDLRGAMPNNQEVLDRINAAEQSIKSDLHYITIEQESQGIQLDEHSGELDLLVGRTVNTAEADLAILAEEPARVVGPAIPIGNGGGTLDITGAVGVLVQLSNIPALIGRLDVVPPTRYPRRLGNVALVAHGGAERHIPLEWETSYIPVDNPAYTALHWHIYPPATATVRLVTQPEE